VVHGTRIMMMIIQEGTGEYIQILLHLPEHGGTVNCNLIDTHAHAHEHTRKRTIVFARKNEGRVFTTQRVEYMEQEMLIVSMHVAFLESLCYFILWFGPILLD
jgi:hypothetical protein